MLPRQDSNILLLCCEFKLISDILLYHICQIEFILKWYKLFPNQKRNTKLNRFLIAKNEKMVTLDSVLFFFSPVHAAQTSAFFVQGQKVKSEKAESTF